MPDREKVIKGLECRLDINGSKYKHCLTCDYRHDIDHCQWTCQTDGILEDAIALLKAQEPRMMTLEEVRRFEYGSPYIIETNLPGDEPRLMYGLYSHQGVVGNFDFSITDGRKRLLDADYGKTWRCWTSRPTDEQREATPW